MMQAIESPDPNMRVKELQQRLSELENASSAVLRTRLARAHPWHITRIARIFFLGLTVLSVILVLGSLILPVLMPEAARFMADIERATPLPFPVLALILALCMAVAWVTAGQAAVSIGRDCPLLPWEEEEARRLRAELGVLSNTAAFITANDDAPPPLDMPPSRIGSATPAYLKPRGPSGATPASTPGGTLQYESVGDPLSGRRPSPMQPPRANPSASSRAPAGSGSFAGGSYASGGSPAGSSKRTPASGGRRLGVGTPSPASRLSAAGITPRPMGTPRPAPGVYGTPNPAGTPRPMSYGSSGSGTPRPPQRSATPAANLSYRGPEPDAFPKAPPPRPATDPISYDRSPVDGYTIGPEAAGDPISTSSWSAPRFSKVDEPWLADALGKAQDLARRYPVQAFLEYSVEPDLPFTLVLERATPAMAVRAMVDFVGFLASIATPRRARIELRSVVHLDRSFYRSVMSAMEPYFPDTVDIHQQGYRVEITFLEPDRNWTRYPILPLEE